MAKLSDAQIKVLVELNTNGVLPKGTQPRTVEKLREAGLIDVVRFGDEDTQHIITPTGQKEIGVPVVDREKVAQIQEIEELLQPISVNVVDREAQNAPQVTAILDSDGVVKYPEWVDRFDHRWADWECELMGFDFVSGWKGVEVWNGLTAAEIKEDMETARPVNREAKRTHFRTLRNAFRRMNNTDNSRKSKKITGAVGL